MPPKTRSSSGTDYQVGRKITSSARSKCTAIAEMSYGYKSAPQEDDKFGVYFSPFIPSYNNSSSSSNMYNPSSPWD